MPHGDCVADHSIEAGISGSTGGRDGPPVRQGVGLPVARDGLRRADSGCPAIVPQLPPPAAAIAQTRKYATGRGSWDRPALHPSKGAGREGTSTEARRTQGSACAAPPTGAGMKARPVVGVRLLDLTLGARWLAITAVSLATVPVGAECLRAENVRRDTRESQETDTQWQLPATNSRVPAPVRCDFSSPSGQKDAISAVMASSGHAHGATGAQVPAVFRLFVPRTRQDGGPGVGGSAPSPVHRLV